MTITNPVSTMGNAYAIAKDVAAKLDASHDSASTKEIVPAANNAISNLLGTANKPEIASPSVSVLGDGALSKANWLSAEVLAELLQASDKKNMVAGSLNQIEVNAQKRREENNARMEELNNKIKELEKQEKMSPIKKVFSKLSNLLAIIGAALTLAIAIACPNPLTIAAATLAIITTVDGMMDTLSDGKISLTAGITKLCVVAGAPSDIASYIAQGTKLALTIATVVTGLCSANSAKAAEAIAQVVQIVENGEKVVNTGLGIAGSLIGIAQTVSEFNVANANANLKDIQSILDKLKASDDVEVNKLKEKLQNSNSMLQHVQKIYEDTNSALSKAASAPLMA